MPSSRVYNQSVIDEVVRICITLDWSYEDGEKVLLRQYDEAMATYNRAASRTHPSQAGSSPTIQNVADKIIKNHDTPQELSYRQMAMNKVQAHLNSKQTLQPRGWQRD